MKNVSINLGKWLSAALGDPAVCEEMKADINAWFKAGEPLPDGRKCDASISADPPRDCNYPLCGCDPLTEKVIVALQECNMLRDEPVKMVLYCPKCGTQHIDAPEPFDHADDYISESGTLRERWDNPPHRSHLCAKCGCTWRPADVATVGVESIETQGKADTWGKHEGLAAKGTGPFGPNTNIESIRVFGYDKHGQHVASCNRSSNNARSDIDDMLSFLEFSDGVKLRNLSFPETKIGGLLVRPSHSFDLYTMAMGQILQAARESNWIPKEYVMDHWLSDICNFLRYGEETAINIRATLKDAFTTCSFVNDEHVVESKFNSAKEAHAYYSFLVHVLSLPIRDGKGI